MFPCVEVVHFYHLLSKLLFHVSFSASIRLMLFLLKLSYMNSFKNIIRETGVVDYYNIITSKPRGLYLPLFKGRKN